MPVENVEIAAAFDEVADLLEITGAGYFRVRAYRNASRVIRDLSTPLHRMIAEPDFKPEDLPGIGRDLSGKVREMLDTGDLAIKRELEEQLPPGILEVTKVAGIGPRKAHTLFLELGIGDLESLGEAARDGRVRGLKGFGPKTEANIMEGIFALKEMGHRMLWSEAEVFAGSILEYMRGTDGIVAIEVAGSFRRRAETVGDLDILVTCKDAAVAMDRFTSCPGVSRVIAKGPTKSSVVIGSGVQVDLRVVEEGSFGAALVYFTGSKAHNVALRSMALKRGLKLNEYGVFRGDDYVAGATEEDVYGALGLPWIPPELRENRGEISLALDGAMPVLIGLADIRGDLHMHTDATDGRDSLETMAVAARARGYLYIAVTNHSKRVSMVGGLDEGGLLSHWREVAALDERLRDIHVLKGVEVDILEDGSLDIADDVLAQADYVVASVHYNMDLPRARMTRRIVKAVNHPLVDALGHATGRKLNRRPGYQVEIDDVIAAAARTGTWLELNAAPDRLDIDDLTCAAARSHGVMVSIATDAHHAGGLDFMRYGVNQARRGGLEAGDVVNALTYRSLARALRARKRDGA